MYICKTKKREFSYALEIIHMKVINSFTVLYCPVNKCDRDSPFSATKQLLEHLESKHEIKIHEPATVAPFIDQYLKNYEEILQEEEGGPRVIGGNEALFPDDLVIRQNLTSKMLNRLLQTQQMERNTIYKRARMCLFCSEISSNLHELFAHMFQVHHFNIGLLDNLIFIEAFLNELEEMTKFKKQCLFCMETFRNGTCLRKHMKSKNHFKISGKDERWDQFYLINYVNLNNKTNDTVNRKDNANFKNEPEPLEEEDNNWDDLDDEIDLQTQCLFCNEILSNPEDCFIHMQNLHSFNLKNIQREHNLKFYDTMKLINYFRNCQREDTNSFGDTKDGDGSDYGGAILKQKFEMNKIPSCKLWNRPEFYFPVYEEDPLLTAIESDEEGTEI